MQELADVIETGGYADLLQAVDRLNDRQRKSAAAWFVMQWKERRDQPHPNDRAEPQARWMRLLVGLTAAAADPKKALAIPARHWAFQFRSTWEVHDFIEAASAEAIAALAQAAIGHGPDWCAQYIALVTDAKKPRPMFAEVLLSILRAHALPLPPTPVLPTMWATLFFRRLPPDPSRQAAGDPTASSAAADLRADPDAPAMLLALFDHRDALNALVGRYGGQYEMDQATQVIGELIADGTLDAARLARQAIAALSRGDSVSCQRLQTRLLKAARPDTVLVGESARVLANLIASASGPAAVLAQELLREADASAALPDDLFVDACQMAFARKEKGLREAQLGWARARAARPASCACALHGTSAALLCPDHAVQKAAVGLFESAWPALDAATRAALLAPIEASQGVLDPALYGRLWAACTGGAAAPLAEKPRRAEPLRTGMRKQPYVPVEDPAQLPADVMRAVQTYHLARDALAHERLIGAAHDALRAGHPVLARAIGRHLVPNQPFCMHIGARETIRCEMSHVAYARGVELQQALADGQPQRFVSTPSWTHGAIEPAHLADRLEALAQAGQTALPVDLLVALLRTEACDAETLARLRTIGSAQARAAADFLAAGGAAQLTTRWLVTRGDQAGPRWRSHDVAGWIRPGESEVCVALDAVAQAPAIEGAPLAWAAGFEPATAPFASEFDMAPDWITPMLPNNAEALAALHLWGFRRAGLEFDTEGGKNVAIRLPLYLAAHGPAGPALHLAVLFAMSGNDAPVRLAGSDAMVTLLQQGRWSDALAGDLLAACLRCGSVKPGRLAASLVQVREAGEVEAIWSLVRAGIAAALGMSPVPTATADLIALGVDAAGDLGVKESIVELAAVVGAIKGKPNKLQTQAQRLHACLSE